MNFLSVLPHTTATFFSGSHSPTENEPIYFLTVLPHTTVIFLSGSHSPTENAPIYFLTVLIHTTAPILLWVPQSHRKCSYMFSNYVPSHNCSFIFSGSHSPTENSPLNFLSVLPHTTATFFSGSHSPTENAPIYFLTVLIHTIAHIFLWVPQSHRKCSNIFSNCVPSHNCSYLSLGPTVPQKKLLYIF